MTLNFMENEEVEGKSLDDQLKDQLKVQSNTTSLNLQTICHEIDLGKAEKGGIKLKPFYQRDYKFTKKDESFLIESLIILKIAYAIFHSRTICKPFSFNLKIAYAIFHPPP